MRSIEYTWIGDISSKFGSVIEDIGQEKSSALTTWCEVDDGDANFDASTFIGCDPDENVPLFFLLSSWRAFLLVMSKDSPFSLYLPRAAAAASFISCLAPYTATWRQEHPSSLLLLYRASCRLLHTATALLMRPSLLSSLVKKETPMEDARRVRSLSTSTSCTGLEA